jgi:hypothetical protein
MPYRIYETFFETGEVVEIRAIGRISGKNRAWKGSCFGKKPIVAGYFDNADDFEKCAKALDEIGPEGIYFTINPVAPAFLSRAVNRLQANLSPTTSDDNIQALRWLLIDIDPKIEINPGKWTHRPGISSTKGELNNAKELAKSIAEWLENEMGLARAVRACSGNGYHLNYRIPDLDNTEENRHLVRDCLLAIEQKWRSEKADIDLSVFNPARIWKLYGTTARKGDSTELRPHRKSYIFPKSPKSLSKVPI